MGRTPSVFKKRKFTGNIHTRKTLKPNLNESEESTSQQRPITKFRVDSSVNISTNSAEFLCSGYRIIEISLLSAAVRQSCACANCKNINCMEVCEEKRTGLASILQVKCTFCDHSISFCTSKTTENKQFYETNVRMAYGMRCIGKGRKAAAVFCGVMNLPPPILKFDNVNKFILSAIEPLAKERMKSAVGEVVNLRLYEGEESPADIAVSVDGTWMKRGHTSNYGLSSVISIDTGKVLDVDVKSKYCHECATRKKLADENQEKEWQTKHMGSCSKNYEGPSGGMEVATVVSMFNRSQDQYGVRYSHYLGDGDCKSFNSVLQADPYDNLQVKKLECVGHVQKRMGGRLRRLVKDNKNLGGRGRLTAKVIDSLQVFYGKAIRENLNSVDDMKKAVWASYFHKSSTDAHPIHNLCPKGDNTWCKYRKDPGTYEHKNSLPRDVLDKIKPVYRVLAHPDLLSKCVHGKTQNSNESFNSVMWNRCPKTKFCGLSVVKIAMYDAILCFNEGESTRFEVMKRAGMEGGLFTKHIFNSIDKKKIDAKEVALSHLEKEARKQRRSVRREREDEDDPDYSYGGF